jgi:outer membrane protein, heavy metal efflux system
VTYCKLLIATLVATASLHAQAVKLEDVLESVRKHYPPLMAALEEKSIADADLLAAQGRFDFTLRARTDNDAFGYYENSRVDFGFDQPISNSGLSFFGGYRVGSGDFADYDGKLDTRSLGEIRSGFRLPLLRDRNIDSRRGEVAKARIGQQLANLSIDQQKLVILQTAMRRYWDWLAAGRRLAVTRDILKIAETRQQLIEEAVTGGQLPAIEAADNRRAILQRRSQVVEADRLFQQTAFELSLFYRDDAGRPNVLGLDRLPPDFPTAIDLDPARLDSDVRLALSRRPDLVRLSAQKDSLEVDARLAENARKPALDVVTGFTAEGGSGSVRRGPQELKTALVFEFPWQNRTATGRLAAAEARIRQIAQREKFLREQITTEVNDAASAVRASFQRWKILNEEVQVAQQLQDAEKARFDLGEGTLFILNLREQATVDAAVREISAQADFHRAMAVYEFMTGELLNK